MDHILIKEELQEELKNFIESRVATDYPLK